jgi:hypothetical protein
MTYQNLKMIKKFFIFNCHFAFCIFIFAFIQILLVFLISKDVFANEVNNKFGIHLAQPHLEDLKKVAELVNSNGGDWGYVTLVIQENDRDSQKWQEIFDLLRKYHLIPIIRLATMSLGDNWKRPNSSDAYSWASFLDSLNWVVKNRYVVLFNEPNHATEWGGAVDPKDYAKVAFAFAKTLKERNPNFFVMLAGFDASAPHLPPKFYDEKLFLKDLIDHQPEIFKFIDGWASHSYPNPAFSGSPYDFGRGTVRTYQWELNLLRQLGVEKELPVFITETGWERKKLSEEQVAQNFKIAFEQVWLPDEKIISVTPFVFDYQMEPFLGFSWKRKGDDGFYQQYYFVQSVPKTKGEPDQEEKGEIIFDLPKELVNKSTYQFKIRLKNQGQGYWDERNYGLLVNDVKKTEFLIGNLGEISPNEEKEVNFYLKTKDEGQEKIKFILQKNGKNILESKDWYFNILALPSLKIKTGLFPKLNDSGFDFELQIFDEKESLVFQKKNLLVKVGKGEVANIENIVFGKRYRLVLLKPYYLPRQNYLVFKKGKNRVSFKPMLPLDFNLDGKFSLRDILELIKKPKLLKLLFP